MERTPPTSIPIQGLGIHKLEIKMTPRTPIKLVWELSVATTGRLPLSQGLARTIFHVLKNTASFWDSDHKDTNPKSGSLRQTLRVVIRVYSVRPWLIGKT